MAVLRANLNWKAKWNQFPVHTGKPILGSVSELQRAEVAEVAVEQLADAFVILQAEVIVLVVWRRQTDESVQREADGVRRAAALQEEVRRVQRRQIEIRHLTNARKWVRVQK